MELARRISWRSIKLDPDLKVIQVIDKMSDWSGRIVSYLIFPMVGLLTYEVFARYLFHAPTEWAYDVTYIFYGTIFMLGASYTLLNKGHIRTDMLYGRWPAKRQGKIDTVMYLALFFPGMIFFLIAGIDYAAYSWSIQERAMMSPWRPIIYPFKTVIPLTALMLLIQGISELLKSLYAWKKGEWR